jgi:cell division protein FtsB
MAHLIEKIKECAPVEKVQADMKQEVDALKAEREALKKQNEKLEKENAELKNVGKGGSDEMLKAEVAAVKNENVGLKDEIKGLNQEIRDLQRSCKQQVAEIMKLTEKKENKASNFTVGVDGKVFRVDKEVLAANSPVLKKLIDENRDADHLELEDITEKTFKEILNFMYTRKLSNNATNLLELFSSSARLQMKELMDVTAKILIEKVTPDTALDVLKLSKKFGHEELSKKAFSELKKNFPHE